MQHKQKRTWLQSQAAEVIGQFAAICNRLVAYDEQGVVGYEPVSSEEDDGSLSRTTSLSPSWPPCNATDRFTAGHLPPGMHGALSSHGRILEQPWVIPNSSSWAPRHADAF